MPTEGRGELWSEPEGLEVQSFANLAELAAVFPALEAAAAEALAAKPSRAGEFKGFEVHLLKSGRHIDARQTAVPHAVWAWADGRPGNLQSAPFIPLGRVDNWLTMSRLVAGKIERLSYREPAAQAAFARALDATKGAAASIERLADLAARRPQLSPVVALVLQVASEAFRAGRDMREAELAERFELDIEAKESFTKARSKGGRGAAKELQKRANKKWRTAGEKIIRDERGKDRNVPEDAIVASVQEKLGQGKPDWPSTGSIAALKRKIVALDRTLESDRERRLREKREAK